MLLACVLNSIKIHRRPKHYFQYIQNLNMKLIVWKMYSASREVSRHCKLLLYKYPTMQSSSDDNSSKKEEVKGFKEALV